MLEWIVTLVADVLDATSEWWLKKAADRSERKHPQWYGGEQKPR